MNAGFDRHYSEPMWEDYAMGRLSGEECERLEEHLLICSTCQDLLAEVDQFIRVTRAALSSTRSRLSKPMSSALTLDS
jgi:Putative zinc-finger